ncbi:MAG: hypothetical protein JRJ77_04990 [Deltaproteobacteria bacterium]|nr:hypothetical protein [Deltaproteobacteria bacterium]
MCARDIALLLAGLAPGTDPPPTTDVVHETRVGGAFTSILLGIVATQHHPDLG